MKTAYRLGRHAAFTLIELLVVIAVIVMVAGVGVAIFRGRNTGTSLSSAQLLSVSLLNSVRAQAASTGRNARLLVAADTSSAAEGEYLRRIYVAYQEVTNQSTGATTWRVTDGGTALPPGIYVVPESLSSTQMATGVSTFASQLQSNFSGTATASLSFTGVKSSTFWYIEMTPRGTLSGGPDRLVLASAQDAPPGSTPPGPRFDNADNVRGFRISTYGVPTLVNDAPSFQ